jgi:putative transposase
MLYDPEIHHRRSIRLKGYDYSQPGEYFITFNTQNNLPLLGKIQDGEVVLTRAGQIVRQVWLDLPRHHLHVRLDEFILMPQHVHGIILLVEGVSLDPKPRSNLSEIVRALKSFSARRINAIQRTPGQPVWQRNYYEHIIRDDHEMAQIRQYIRDNPKRSESAGVSGRV